ncbi:M20/M25/M40 family metallo-hydrolase [Acinetobacter sp.]|uniref:M20/M25/M40 family metallo-hydrolase n=1 Tax=Acinetobacter sp. TaxID=472 RepID=UPI0035AF1FCC
MTTLKTLVNIESGSKDIEGLNQISKTVAEQLKSAGAEVSVIQPKDIMKLDGAPDQTGPVVKAVLKGKGQRNIMLLAHNDTVYQKGQPFRLEGNKAYGLGILDDKQGVAAVIHVLEMLQQLKYQDYGTLTVLINSDEEISSPGSRQLIMDTAKNQDVVLSFETGGLEASAQAKKLAAQAQQIYRNELNLPMKVETAAWGGGTDAAFAGVTSKAAIIEGMGMSGDGLHSDKAEYILTDSIVPRLYLAARLIVESSKK